MVPLGEPYPGDLRAVDVGGVEDAQFARRGRGVVHHGEDPAVVLGHAVRLGDDDGFCATAAVTELVGLGRAPLDVDLDDRAAQICTARRQLRGVAVAMLLEADLRIVTWELLRAIVDAGLGDPSGGRVDHPSIERRQRVAEWPVEAEGHHRVVPAHVDDHRAVGCVVGVEGMEHVAGRDVAPDDVVGGTAAGEEADSRRGRGSRGNGNE